MQLLSEASTGSSLRRACARAVLEGVPPVIWHIRRQMRRHRGLGLSVPQFRVLVLLDRFPTAGLSAVAEHLGAALPTVSRIVSGLVAKGLIARAGRADDRRCVSLVLTPRGQAVLQQAWGATEQSVAQRLAGLTAAQQRTIRVAADLLRGAFATEEGPGAAAQEAAPAPRNGRK